eukprot:scaffold10082_cov115-Isochrysis_galbana.AAC.12
MRGGLRRCRLAGGLAMVSPRGDMSAAKRTSVSRARARLHGEERLARPLPRSGPRGRHPHPPTHPVAQGVLGRPQREKPAGAGPLRHKCTGTRGCPPRRGSHLLRVWGADVMVRAQAASDPAARDRGEEGVALAKGA